MSDARASAPEEHVRKEPTRFVAAETRSRGGFGLGFYKRYFLSMRGLAWAGPLLLASIIVDTFFANGFRWMVAMRLEGCGEAGALCAGGPWYEAGVRGFLAALDERAMIAFLAVWIGTGVLVRAASWTGVLGFLSNGGRYLHNAMVDSLARVRVTFFDENPTGRVVRRFSGDYAQLKHEIPNYVNDIVTSAMELAWVFVLVSLQAPLAALACVPCAFLYFRVQGLYRPAARETQRLAKVLETPVWSLFTESVAGYQTIRAYGRAPLFVSQLQAHVQRAAFGAMTQSRLTRWLNVRLKVTSEMFGLCVALFIAWACSSGRMGVGTAGFLMSLTIGLDVTMQWLTRTLSLIEGTMVSLERILEYRDLPHEAPRHVATLSSAFGLGEGLRAPVADLELEGVVASYRPDLPLVLKGVDVRIAARRRVGVIGKTGAGKSTLFQAFYRMLHLHGGTLRYGGVDLATLPVREARSLFGIIPQEPHVFSGTIRFNLDRLTEHTDSTLWEALRLAELEAFVRNLPGQLDAPVYERGANLSVGERQLLCLARTALLGAPVILMDEPTSSVDRQTDEIITASARRVFAGRTVFVIAHRLETVLECDEVILVDDGTVVDQGPPREVTARFLARYEGATLEEALV